MLRRKRNGSRHSWTDYGRRLNQTMPLPKRTLLTCADESYRNFVISITLSQLPFNALRIDSTPPTLQPRELSVTSTTVLLLSGPNSKNIQTIQLESVHLAARMSPPQIRLTTRRAYQLALTTRLTYQLRLGTRRTFVRHPEAHSSRTLTQQHSERHLHGMHHQRRGILHVYAHTQSTRRLRMTTRRTSWGGVSPPHVRQTKNDRPEK